PLHIESYQLRAKSFSGSPAGGSTLVTIAPSLASRDAATGPGVLMLRLTTFIPCSSSECSAMPARIGHPAPKGQCVHNFLPLTAARINAISAKGFSLPHV